MPAVPGIYRPHTDGDPELCHPIDDKGFEAIIELIDGTPRKATWDPIYMQVVREDRGKILTRSDSPWIGANALIFRSTVLAAIGPLLEGCGELLPLVIEEGEDLWIFNPSIVLNALDEQASTVERDDDGDILWIDRHVFRSESVAESDAFKITSLSVSPTFVSHRFVDAWRKSALRGLRFVLVWAAP